MIDTSASGNSYNRLDNLDGIEDRIIYYLLRETNKTEREKELVHRIWRILYYNDVNALKDDEKHPLPEIDDIEDLVSNDDTEQQNTKRIFRSPRLEDLWTQECTLLKVYVDSIIPENHLGAMVNVGIDVVVNTKIINVAVPNNSENTYIDNVGKHVIPVKTKSRVTTMTQAIISLLNGASVQGVGKLTFNKQNSIFNKAQYGIWNNRNFEGMKIVMGVYMSGVN